MVFSTPNKRPHSTIQPIAYRTGLIVAPAASLRTCPGALIDSTHNLNGDPQRFLIGGAVAPVISRRRRRLLLSNACAGVRGLSTGIS